MTVSNSRNVAFGNTVIKVSPQLTREHCPALSYLQDFAKGYSERLAGYYDKWYRRYHRDEGAAYDDGSQAATLDPRCKPDCFIIECNTF